MRKHLLGPCPLDDGEALLEGFAVGGVDLVVLMRLRAGNPVGLLRHDIDPSALVAAREAGVDPAARHMIEHRDIFGDANRILRRQHDPELADPQPLGLHRDVQVEQNRIVGKLEAFDMKVMLGEADRIVAQVVGEPGLRGDFEQHPIVEIAAHPGHPLFDIGPAPDRRQVEERHFHATLYSETAPETVAAAGVRKFYARGLDSFRAKFASRT